MARTWRLRFERAAPGGVRAGPRYPLGRVARLRATGPPSCRGLGRARDDRRGSARSSGRFARIRSPSTDTSIAPSRGMSPSSIRTSPSPRSADRTRRLAPTGSSASIRSQPGRNGSDRTRSAIRPEYPRRSGKDRTTRWAASGSSASQSPGTSGGLAERRRACASIRLAGGPPGLRTARAGVAGRSSEPRIVEERAGPSAPRVGCRSRHRRGRDLRDLAPHRDGRARRGSLRAGRRDARRGPPPGGTTGPISCGRTTAFFSPSGRGVSTPRRSSTGSRPPGLRSWQPVSGPRRPRPRNRAMRRPPPALPGSPPGWSTALSSRRMPSATSSRSRPPRRPPGANGLREIPVVPLSTLARAMEGEDREILAVAGCDDRVVE